MLEIHDTSAIDAITASREAHNRTKIFVGAGIGGLFLGIGAAAALWGYSLVREPKVITTEKVVVTEKVERVEIPKIIEKEKIERVEIPKIIEKEKLVQVPVPQPSIPAAPQPQTPPVTAPFVPAPAVGQKATEEQFKNSTDFLSSKFNGRVVSHVKGVVTFDNGRTLVDAYPDGTPDQRITSTRHNGEVAYCADAHVKFPSGAEQWHCDVLHRGVVENLFVNHEIGQKPQLQSKMPTHDWVDDIFN